MPKKLTYEFVKNSFEKEGYTLLSKDYIKAKDKLNFICPKGHDHFMSWNAFKEGKRCYLCYGNIKLNLDHIKQAFQDKGWQLLTTKYVNCREKLEFICDNGHIHKIKWTPFNRGIGCAKCKGQLKTEKELKICEVKKTMILQINNRLRYYSKNKLIKSNSGFVNSIVKEIYEKLGSRPNDHHLDHIVPASWFDLREAEQIKMCWNINNLQWLNSTENIKKGNTPPLEYIYNFTIEQLYILLNASKTPKKYLDFVQRKYPLLYQDLKHQSSELPSNSHVVT